MAKLSESKQRREKARVRPREAVEDPKNVGGSSKGKSHKRSKTIDTRSPTPEYYPSTRGSSPEVSDHESSSQSKNETPSRVTKKGATANDLKKSKKVTPAETQPKVPAEKQSRVPETQQRLKGKIVKRRSAEAMETPYKGRDTTPPGCSDRVPRKDTYRREIAEKDRFVTPEASKQVINLIELV